LILVGDVTASVRSPPLLPSLATNWSKRSGADLA